jgi:ABC-type dipeptide/oligopeptide/nickel transport system permease component
MGTYIARRLLLMIPTLIGITFLVFMMVALAPGGIGATLKVSAGGTMQSQQGTALLQAYLEDRYGLDDPVVVQYVRWLGRISPIKFSARDQVAPSGERIQPPKPIKEPPLWPWYASSLPGPVPAGRPEPAANTPEQRIDEYRAAAKAYADARAAYVGLNTTLRLALVQYARDAGLDRAVTRGGKVRLWVLRAHTPRTDRPAFQKVKDIGGELLAVYARAIAARDRLDAAFRSQPYRQAGIAVVPGVLSVSSPDLGYSYSRGRPASALIRPALPVTLLIDLIAFPIIYMIAIPAGMLAASRKGTWVDVGIGALLIALYSCPVVLAGVFAIGFLASNDYLGWFPVSGLHANTASTMPFLPRAGSPGYLGDLLWHIALPVICLVYGGFAVLSKQTRAAMLDNFNADYVRTAKAKGVSNRDVVLRHVFRNSLLPLITMFVTIFPAMLAGSVVIEKIFTVPGMGSLTLDAIVLRDRELLLANTLMIASVNLMGLLLADILYAIADPRISYA